MKHPELPLVERFIALVETHDLPLPVQEVARRLGVPDRTLRHIVNRHCGKSPRGYMRSVRLARAHAALLAGESVTQSASEFGFWNFGRFAQEYRGHFGELPSETRQRALSATGVSA